MKRGKRYLESEKLVDSAKQYESSEAMDLVVQTAKAKFDETVEIHVKLGVDSRHATSRSGVLIVLPHGQGKTTRVSLFLQRAIRLMRQRRQVPIMSVQTTLSRKFRMRTGLSLTLLLQLPT